MDGYSGTCGDSVNWEYDPDTGTLRIYGSGAMYDYDNFRNCAPWYDYCFDIKKCVIESGVTYIGTLAFYECEYMTEIVIGDNVTSFGNRVFEYSGLERYTVSENNSVYSSDSYGVLFNKNKTELIECRLHGINVYEMPDSVEYISSSSFIHSRNITSITISKNVISIEQNAFYGQGELTTIIFKGSTPPNMGTLAFALGRNYIEPITATVYTTGWGSDDVFTTDIRGSNTTFIYELLPLSSGQCGDTAYWEFDPDTGTLRIFGTGAMWDFSMTGDFEPGVEELPWKDYCNDITSVVIDEGITSIGGYAFNYRLAPNLTSVSLPEGLEEINPYAFYNSTIRSIDLPESLTHMGANVFAGSRIASITIPEGITAILAGTFLDCAGLQSIIILGDVTNIYSDAFRRCTSLTSITFMSNSAPVFDDGSFCLGTEDFPVTATVYTTGWGSDDAFTYYHLNLPYSAKNEYTTFIYKTLGGSTIPSFVDVTFSSNPVNTGIIFILSVDVEEVEQG